MRLEIGVFMSLETSFLSCSKRLNEFLVLKTLQAYASVGEETAKLSKAVASCNPLMKLSKPEVTVVKRAKSYEDRSCKVNGFAFKQEPSKTPARRLDTWLRHWLYFCITVCSSTEINFIYHRDFCGISHSTLSRKVHKTMQNLPNDCAEFVFLND